MNNDKEIQGTKGLDICQVVEVLRSWDIDEEGILVRLSYALEGYTFDIDSEEGDEVTISDTMSCPMCEEGVMEYRNIRGIHTYSCEVCPFQGIEGVEHTVEDLIEKFDREEVQ